MEGRKFDPPDYSIIEGTEAAYRGFFPRQEPAFTPPGAYDFMVPVAQGVAVGCRLYPSGPAGPAGGPAAPAYRTGRPTILYFHGNGEIVSDYDDVAPLYTGARINLAVADYRGYGFSTGMPSFPTMLADAHQVLHTCQELLKDRGFSGPLFIMGRSMGCHSAVELAAHYPDAFKGLITESGSTSAARMVAYLESVGRSVEAAELQRRHTDKVRSISLPVLVLHGEWDELIPLERALEFFNLLATEQKRMEIIPGAGHNDILWVGRQQYMGAIREFVARTSG